MKRTRFRLETITSILLAVFASLILTASAQAGVYTVTKTADTNDGTCNADCSLREAIAAANATADNDTVEFAAAVFGTPQTITLGGTELLIANNGTLAISGPGASQLTVSGNSASRVFLIVSGANAAISDITVSGGNGVSANTSGTGGGILNFGALSLTNANVSNNTAASLGGGIANFGFGSVLTVTNATVSNNTAAGNSGGGIYATGSGTLTVTNSTISGNWSAGNGGGIRIFNGTATLTGSTVSGNTALGNGGGISNSGAAAVSNSLLSDNIANNGGGAANLNAGSTLTLTDSTVSGNSTVTGNPQTNAGGGLYNITGGTLTVNNSTVNGNSTTNTGAGIYNRSNLTLNNSTVSGNTGSNWGGGGIRVEGGSSATLNNSTVSNNPSAIAGGGISVVEASTATLNNTIIANSPTGVDCFNNGSTVNAAYSLIENGLPCVNGTNSNNLTGDPNLGALAGNGGATQTHALLSCSPAIDAGNLFASAANDQRGAGFLRTVNLLEQDAGDGTDIGAFEAQTQLDCTPPVITPTVSGTFGNDGWYISDVQIVWSVSDAESIVSSQTGCDSQTVSSDTSGIIITCSAESAGGTSSQSVTVKRDATAPTLAPTVTPNPVLSGAAATAAANASDNLSGVVSQSCETPQTALVGAKSLTCTATDAAGNTANGSVSYQVNSRFAFSGFLQPVDNLPAVNIATAGQAVPVKFSIGGNFGLNLFAAGYPASGPIPCEATEAGSTIEETVTAGGSTLTYDAATGRYSYVWKTDKAWKDTCRIFVLRLVDGSQYMAKFRFR
jgi:CSLREA domain-containing protein